MIAIHKHFRASLMYCIIAETHGSKLVFKIQNDDWLIQSLIKMNMMCQIPIVEYWQIGNQNGGGRETQSRKHIWHS